MVVAGKECTRPVADATWGCLRWHVPAAVLGIVFPSGAQHGRLATAHLNAINRLQTPKPWQVSFSSGRALQDSAARGMARAGRKLRRRSAGLLPPSRLKRGGGCRDELRWRRRRLMRIRLTAATDRCGYSAGQCNVQSSMTRHRGGDDGEGVVRQGAGIDGCILAGR
jgi:hypothetical protein